MGAMALAQPAAEADAGTGTGAGPDAGTPPPSPPPPPKAKPDAGSAPKPDAGTDAGTPPPHAPHGTAPAALNEKARAFFAALLAGEPGPLVQQAELPFFLEDKRITSAEQLKSEWLNQLRSKRTDLLSLKGFVILTPAEMEQRFGKPPPRLSSWPISSGKTYLVVADVSGRAAVALYHQAGDEWRIVAYHD